MQLIYIVFVFATISTVRGIVNAVKKKSIKDFFLSILPFPFFFSFFLGVISGGSALNDAQKDYELYQAGHYYLESHDNWTEVSYGKYMAVFISEIIGLSSFALSFILGIIRNAKHKLNPT